MRNGESKKTRQPWRIRKSGGDTPAPVQNALPDDLEQAAVEGGIVVRTNMQSGGEFRLKGIGRVILAVWAGVALGLGSTTGRCETTAEPAKPKDLTSMSLEDLLHEDITPINVLGSHTHHKGGFMVGYRYMFTDQDDILDGTRRVSPGEVLQQYPVAHTGMTMHMHMLELMYAPSDYITVMGMVPYEDMYMDHLFRDGSTRTDHSSGVGDLSFMGLFNLVGDPRAKGHRLLLNQGFTVPTGSINEGRNGQRFEYVMQLGSGTFDWLPGLTYLGESEDWAWGAQALGTVRFGSNENHYRLGNAYKLNAWTQYKVTDWFGPSVRLDWNAWDNIHGADPQLDPTRNPAFDATKQSGARLDFLAGLNFYIPNGVLKGNSFSVEGGVPLYQYITGPNLAVTWMITFGWNYSFH